MHNLHAIAIVRYGADEIEFNKMVESLSPFFRIFVFDNSINPISIRCEGVRYFHDESNPGLGAALNFIISSAIKEQYKSLTYFDQDSIVNVGLVEKLYFSLESISKIDPSIFACGPQPVTKSGKNYPVKSSGNYLSPDFLYCSELITSGLTFNLDIVENVGGFNEELFLDLVDFELCWRSLKHGYSVVLCKNVKMTHQVGENSINFLGRLLPISSPMRNYYQIRNLILIAKTNGFPSASVGVWYIFRRLVNIGINIFFANSRIDRLRWNTRGLIDGIRGKGGKICG